MTPIAAAAAVGAIAKMVGPAPQKVRTRNRSRRRLRPATAVVEDAATATRGAEGSHTSERNSGGRRRNGEGRTSGRQGGRESGRESQVGEKGIVAIDIQAQYAATFATGLVEAFGLQASTVTSLSEDGESADVNIEGNELGLLIGPKGRTLSAINEISRAVVFRQLDSAPEGRVHIDVSGYRQRRREALERFARSVAEEVLASGRAKALEPMNAADRKVVHDAVGSIEGIRSSSEGEDPARRVVISPSS